MFSTLPAILAFSILLSVAGRGDVPSLPPYAGPIPIARSYYSFDPPQLSPLGDFSFDFDDLNIRLLSPRTGKVISYVRMPDKDPEFPSENHISNVNVSPDERFIFVEFADGMGKGINLVYMLERSKPFKYRPSGRFADGRFSDAAWRVYEKGKIPDEWLGAGFCFIDYRRGSRFARVDLRSAYDKNFGKLVCSMLYDTRRNRFIHIVRH